MQDCVHSTHRTKNRVNSAFNYWGATLTQVSRCCTSGTVSRTAYGIKGWEWNSAENILDGKLIFQVCFKKTCFYQILFCQKLENFIFIFLFSMTDQIFLEENNLIIWCVAETKLSMDWKDKVILRVPRNRDRKWKERWKAASLRKLTTNSQVNILIP